MSTICLPLALFLYFSVSVFNASEHPVLNEIEYTSGLMMIWEGNCVVDKAFTYVTKLAKFYIFRSLTTSYFMGSLESFHILFDASLRGDI